MSDDHTTDEPVLPFAQLSALLDFIEMQPDPAFRERVSELVCGVIDLHHTALERILSQVSAHPAGAEMLAQLADDEVVRAVLMVHELMPEELEARVSQGLEQAREQLTTFGADVELVGIRDNVARLRLLGSAQSANVSSAQLKFVIEQTLAQFAPDLLNLEYEDRIAATPKLVQISPRPVPPSPKPQTPPAGNLIPLIRTNEVPDNSLRVIATGDINLLVCQLAGTFYAFHNRCPHRGLSLEQGMLEGTVLTCPWHGYQFDIRDAGRCFNDPLLRLQSLPLAVENEVIRVALTPEVNS